jgi:hypothetical protein
VRILYTLLNNATKSVFSGIDDTRRNKSHKPTVHRQVSMRTIQGDVHIIACSDGTSNIIDTNASFTIDYHHNNSHISWSGQSIALVPNAFRLKTKCDTIVEAIRQDSLVDFERIEYPKLFKIEEAVRLGFKRFLSKAHHTNHDKKYLVMYAAKYGDFELLKQFYIENNKSMMIAVQRGIKFLQTNKSHVTLIKSHVPNLKYNVCSRVYMSVHDNEFIDSHEEEEQYRAIAEAFLLYKSKELFKQKMLQYADRLNHEQCLILIYYAYKMHKENDLIPIILETCKHDKCDLAIACITGNVSLFDSSFPNYSSVPVLYFELACWFNQESILMRFLENISQDKSLTLRRKLFSSAVKWSQYNVVVKLLQIFNIPRNYCTECAVKYNCTRTLALLNTNKCQLFLLSCKRGNIELARQLLLAYKRDTVCSCMEAYENAQQQQVQLHLTAHEKTRVNMQQNGTHCLCDNVLKRGMDIAIEKDCSYLVQLIKQFTSVATTL